MPILRGPQMNPFDIFNDIFNDNDFPGMGALPGVNIRMGGPFGSDLVMYILGDN